MKILLCVKIKIYLILKEKNMKSWFYNWSWILFCQNYQKKKNIFFCQYFDIVDNSVIIWLRLKSTSNFNLDNLVFFWYIDN
jgi:hypothetical protein